jgi:O-6-methylguanine DNA methyltransferase
MLYYSKLSVNEFLGFMVAIADESALYALDFFSNFESGQKLRQLINANIELGRTDPIDFLEDELKRYVLGKLNIFHTPIKMMGSSFQREVWLELQNIPFGTTRTYSEIARAINKPLAVRAVANAIGANRFSILVPCHRVIYADGKIGGYFGGLDRKQWLLSHEKQNLMLAI